MIKRLLTVISFALTISTNAQTSWIQETNFGGGLRWGAVGFSIGNKGYIGTGASATVFYNDFWQYNPSDSTWTQEASLPAAGRVWATGFSIGTSGYIGLGVNISSYLNDFYEYNQANNTWTPKTDFAGTAREQTVSFSIDTMGYIGTGITSSNNDFWQYDPSSDTWTQKANFGGSPRVEAVGFSIGNKGYIGTGLDSASHWQNDFWEYDPDTDTWTKKADFPGAGRQFAVGFSIGTEGFLGLGSNESNLRNIIYYTDFYRYDQTTDTWSQKANFPGMGREASVAFSIENRGYVGPGIYNGFSGSGNATYQEDFWEFVDSSFTTGIKAITDKNSSFIYPNPNYGDFTLSYYMPSGNGILQITDVTGRIVYKQIIENMTNTRYIHTSGLKAGQYYWNIITGNKIAGTGKLILL